MSASVISKRLGRCCHRRLHSQMQRIRLSAFGRFILDNTEAKFGILLRDGGSAGTDGKSPTKIHRRHRLCYMCAKRKAVDRNHELIRPETPCAARSQYRDGNVSAVHR